MISIVCALRTLQDAPKVRANLGANTGYEIIFVEGKNPSFQRNEGVKQASGDIIYFMDDDTITPDMLLEKAAKIFESGEKIAVLGGPELNAPDDTMLQKVFGAVFGSVWAAGKSKARYSRTGSRRETDEKELILCNMFIRRDVFLEFGGFNENLYPNEENELLARMKASGLKLIYDPDMFVYRPKRKDWKTFMKQCFNYGRGRAEQSMVMFTYGDIINFVPAFFLLYLIAEAFFGATEKIPLALYAVGTALFSWEIYMSLGKPAAFFRAFAAFFLLHISYGAGSIYGLYTGLNLKEKRQDKNITIRREK